MSLNSFSLEKLCLQTYYFKYFFKYKHFFNIHFNWRVNG